MKAIWSLLVATTMLTRRQKDADASQPVEVKGIIIAYNLCGFLPCCGGYLIKIDSTTHSAQSLPADYTNQHAKTPIINQPVYLRYKANPDKSCV